MTTLEQILDLAEQARRSPHARRVLFDALLDRYGDDFLDRIEAAQYAADKSGVPLFVFVDVPDLIWADEQGQGVLGWDKYLAFPADFFAAHGATRRREKIFLVTLRPRPAGGDR